MVFRFTPVLLLCFLSALIAASSFLLWSSYKNTMGVLQFEQLEQVQRSHRLAEQALQYHLNTVASSLSQTVDACRTRELTPDAMAQSGGGFWDQVVCFESVAGAPAEIVAVLNTDMDAEGVEALRVDGRWMYDRLARGEALAYQHQDTYLNQDGDEVIVWVKGTLYLKDNLPLLSIMQEASAAEAHALVLNDVVLMKTLSFQDSVNKVLDYTIEKNLPFYADDATPLSADLRPLRIENGPKNIALVTVSFSEWAMEWTHKFNDSIWTSAQFVVAIAVAVTVLLRLLTQRSLSKLVNYSKSIRKGKDNVQFKPGAISEYNQVGEVIEEMVSHLSEQGRYIENLMNTAHSPILAWDAAGVITLCNEATKGLFGLQREQKVRLLDDFLHLYRDPNLQETCYNASKGIPTTSLETRLSNHGNLVYILWSVTPLMDEAGHFSGAIAQGQDITARRLVERRLKLASKVFDSTGEAIMITDHKGDIVDVNAAFCEITGYNRGEVVGHNPRIMKSGRHDESFYKEMWRSLHEFGVWRGEIWDKRKNGQIYPKWVSINESLNELGEVTNYVAVFSDITHKKEDQQKLEKLAHFDTLTGLPNRVLFQDRLNSSLARSKREKERMAIMFIDLDRFKQVNDSLGHRIGDMLLCEVAKRLQLSVREVDTVARLSGDEFTVILTDLAQMQDVEIVASRIVKSVGAPYFLDGHELFVSASVGIAIYPEDGVDSKDLMRHADVAMYSAKEHGRNSYRFFNAEMSQNAKDQLSMVNKLRTALNRDEIVPHYQLKVDSISGKPIGMEALARWSDEYGKMISPGVFIPLAEDNGLIVKLGRSILRQACAQARMWKDMGFDFGTIAINLSAQQFRDKELIADIKAAIADNRISPDVIEIEVTENMMMEDVDGAIRILHRLRDMGLKISIDDFGTGYSSLNYLKRFPVDTLKIDRSFIQEITPDSVDAAIVTAVVSLTRYMKVNVVAEGVENFDQVKFLQSINCSVIQGFLYAKPCRGAEVPLIWNDVIEKFST